MSRGTGARSADPERGSGSVVVLVAVTVLVLVGVALAWLGGAVVAQRRVQAAADLAALAGAGALAAGGDACAEGRRVAAANGADLQRCSVQSPDVWVEVGLPGPDLAARTWWLTAQARAGPA